MTATELSIFVTCVRRKETVLCVRAIFYMVDCNRDLIIAMLFQGSR